MTRLKLAKLLYLADLRSVELGGEPRTGFRWIWDNYGPFDRDLLTLEDYLVNRETIVQRKRVPLSPKATEVRLRIAAPMQDDPDLLFWQIVEDFGHMAPASLRDYTYQTAPMKAVQADGKRGDELDLDLARPQVDVSAVARRMRRVLAALPPQKTDPGADAALDEASDGLSGHRGLASADLL